MLEKLCTCKLILIQREKQIYYDKAYLCHDKTQFLFYASN